jgi:sulfur relay (sulfurtransferase) DsrC/TusE family protein
MQTVHVSVSHELSMKNQAYISFIRKVIYNKFGTCPLMNLIKKKKKKRYTVMLRITAKKIEVIIFWY